MSDALTNFPKPINEKLGYGATEDDVYAWFVKYEKTILKALSAYEKLQGVDAMRKSIDTKKTCDFNKQDLFCFGYNQAIKDIKDRMLADINKEERN